MNRPAARRLLANLATLLLIAAAIPAIALVIAYPVWYLGTNHRAVYTAIAVVVSTVLVLRGRPGRR